MTRHETISLETRATPKGMLWTGRVVSVLPFLFMGVMPALLLFAKPAMIADGMSKYGYPASAARPLVIFEIACAILYAVPQTAALGAILLTAYLGGAVATHVRAGEPFFLPIIFAAVVWLGLVLRDERVRSLVPLRRV